MAQMPPIPNQEELDALLDGEAICVLCSNNADGTIHAAPILFRYEAGVFHLGTQQQTQRLANVRRDPRVTLLVEQRVEPYRFAMVYGRASVESEDVMDGRVAILEKLYPAEQARGIAAYMDRNWGIVEIRVEPDRIVTVDYSQTPG